MRGTIAVVAGNGLGSFTAAAGTAFLALVPGLTNRRTRVTSLSYISGATQHTVTAMQVTGTSTVVTAVDAAGTVIVLAGQPTVGNNIATNDYVAYQHTDGTWDFRITTVSSLTLTVAAVAKAIAAGATVYHFGVIGDTVPLTGQPHPAFKPAVSATTTYADDVVGVVAAQTFGYPILLHSGNATAAGVLTASYAHCNK